MDIKKLEQLPNIEKVCMICGLCLLLLFACKRYDDEQYAIATVVAKPFSIIVSGRCELRSKNKEFVETPMPQKHVYVSTLKIMQIREEGTKVRKGDIVAQVGMSELKRAMERWQSELKVAQSALEGARKKLSVEKYQLEMTVKKLQATCRTLELELKLEQMYPGSKTKLEAILAIEEARQASLHKKRQLDSYRYLANRNIASDFDLLQKQLEYFESMALAKEKQLQLAILELGADPLKIITAKHSLNLQLMDLQKAKNDLEHKVQGLHANVARAKKNVYRSEQTLKRTHKFLEDAKLKAPRDGIILYERIWGSNGMEKVKKGMRVWPGQAIVSVQDISDMEVAVEVPETQIALIKQRQQAVVHIDSLDKHKFSGTVIEIDQVARDKKEQDDLQSSDQEKESANEKVFEVLVELKQQDQRLRPGFTGSVDIIVRKFPQVLAIPLTAVFKRAQHSFVYIINNGTIEERRVWLGAISQNQVVILKGLFAGERILLEEPTTVYRKRQSRLLKVVDNDRTLELAVVGTATRGTLVRKVIETGILQPRYLRHIRAEIAGELTEVIAEGAEVNSGDKLFTITPENDGSIEEKLLEKQSLQAEVEQKRNELDLTRKNQNLEVRKSEFYVQQARAKLELLRSKPLAQEVKKARTETERMQYAYQAAEQALKIAQASFAKNLIAKVELSTNKLKAERSKKVLAITKIQESIVAKGPSGEQLRIAEEKLRLAKIKLQQISKTAASIVRKQEIALNVSQAKLAEKEYQLYLQQEEYPKLGNVYAPGAGIVHYSKTSWGKPEIGKKCTKGQRIVFISDDKHMVVKSKVNEVDRQLLKIGQNAQVWLPAALENVFAGKVIDISQVAVDRSENLYSFINRKFSGVIVFEFTVEVLQADASLKNGMSACVQIDLAKNPNVVMVPKHAIVYEPKPCVYIKRAGRATKTPVTLGVSNERYVAITSGVDEGAIIYAPQRAIKLPK